MFNKDIILDLMEQKNWTRYRLAKEAGIPQTSLSDILSGKIKNPTAERLSKLATALGVSVNDFFKDEPVDIPLTAKDERDIKKALDEALKSLEGQQTGLMFDGEPLDDATRQALMISLENSMRLAKQIAKQKYTPKKYRKGE